MQLKGSTVASTISQSPSPSLTASPEVSDSRSCDSKTSLYLPQFYCCTATRLHQLRVVPTIGRDESPHLVGRCYLGLPVKKPSKPHRSVPSFQLISPLVNPLSPDPLAQPEGRDYLVGTWSYYTCCCRRRLSALAGKLFLSGRPGHVISPRIEDNG